jgi:2-oxoglutarate ferredoxin oxidoreductase subunit gamma
VAVVRSVDARQIELPMYQAVMDACGNPLVYNVCVLGAVLGITKVVNVESVMKVLEKRLPPHLMDVNRTALTTGFDMGRNV